MNEFEERIVKGFQLWQQQAGWEPRMVVCVFAPVGRSRLRLAFRFAQALRTVPHGSALVFG